ncbi:MAG: hypothetical protein ACHQAX_08790 [Gammaproteobacteria bacterium]
MNLLKCMVVGTLTLGFAVGTAFAEAATDTTQSETVHIGETWAERLQREMDENNAASQAQQDQQGQKVPQGIGKPVEIDGVNKG